MSQPPNDPIKQLREIGTTAADSAPNVEWEGADELATKLQDLANAAASLSKKGAGQAADAAADSLLKMMQDLGDAAAALGETAKRQADRAQAETDNAKKATTRAKAREAANEAKKYCYTANEQATWVGWVKTADELASEIIKDEVKKQNAQAVATKVGADARNATQYADRARKAAEAAGNIADTA